MSRFCLSTRLVAFLIHDNDPTRISSCSCPLPFCFFVSLKIQLVLNVRLSPLPKSCATHRFLKLLSYSHWPRQCPRKPHQYQVYSRFQMICTFNGLFFVYTEGLQSGFELKFFPCYTFFSIELKSFPVAETELKLRRCPAIASYIYIPDTTVYSSLGACVVRAAPSWLCDRCRGEQGERLNLSKG